MIRDIGVDFTSSITLCAAEDTVNRNNLQINLSNCEFVDTENCSWYSYLAFLILSKRCPKLRILDLEITFLLHKTEFSFTTFKETREFEQLNSFRGLRMIKLRAGLLLDTSKLEKERII
jgi:hypothetical protein